MGLDQNLYKTKKRQYPIIINNVTELNNLVNDNYNKEVMYWRKNYDIQQFLAEQIGIIKNGEYYILSKEVILKLIDFCDNFKDSDPEYQKGWKLMANNLRYVVNETNFDEYDFIYESDW